MGTGKAYRGKKVGRKGTVSGRIKGRRYSYNVMDDPNVPASNLREVEKRARLGMHYGTPTATAAMSLADESAPRVADLVRQRTELARHRLAMTKDRAVAARGLLDAIFTLGAELRSRLENIEQNLEQAQEEFKREDYPRAYRGSRQEV